jgi:RNA polymerase sigma factor (sigma-70 family)
MQFSPKKGKQREEKLLHSSGFKQNSYTNSYFENRNDKEIWDMFREGHIGAFRHIYIKYFNLIFSYGCRITKDSELVKDCIQELFIELHKSQNISATKSIKFYLFRALRWKIYRKMEQGKRFVQMEDDITGFEIEFDEPYESFMIQNQTSEINSRKLKSALVTLTKRQKEALYFFYNQNMDYSQVAEIMNLANIKSARNIIYKAIKQIKERM